MEEKGSERKIEEMEEKRREKERECEAEETGCGRVNRENTLTHKPYADTLATCIHTLPPLWSLRAANDV